MSIATLAARSGIGRATIARLEACREGAGPSMLLDLAAVLGVDPAVLVHGPRPAAAAVKLRLAGVGARVRARRLAAGLSVRQLATRAGLGRMNLWRLENGQVLARPKTLSLVATALGVHAATLWGETELLSADAAQRSSLLSAPRTVGPLTLHANGWVTPTDLGLSPTEQIALVELLRCYPEVLPLTWAKTQGLTVPAFDSRMSCIRARLKSRGILLVNERGIGYRLEIREGDVGR